MLLRRRDWLCRALAGAAALFFGAHPAWAGADAVSKLSDALAGSRSFKVRVQAASLLARMKGPRAVQALARAATADPQPLVRVLCLRLLAKNAATDRFAAQQGRLAM